MRTDVTTSRFVIQPDDSKHIFYSVLYLRAFGGHIVTKTISRANSVSHLGPSSDTAISQNAFCIRKVKRQVLLKRTVKGSPSEYPAIQNLLSPCKSIIFYALFDALDATHVYPIRPAHTADRSRGVVSERGRPARADDNASRRVRAASATRRCRRIRLTHAGDHALQRGEEVGAARTKIHARRQRRARHLRRESGRAGPVHGETERERGAQR